MPDNKILVIEDNLLNLELVSDLLEANGFVVSSANTAEEGLRVARELSPDLVLMDFSLPGMDGLTATRKLKSDPLTRDLTVVALTAHAMKGDEELALSAGCDGYLTKPIDPKTFVPSLKPFLASTERRRQPNNSSATSGVAPPSPIRTVDSLSGRETSSLGFVLVVDDEEHNRALLRDPLEARGYEVDEAENGEIALQRIASHLPDVILLDLMMPRVDGLEVCRQLRRNAATSHVPIVMITALSERNERLRAIEAGANDFLNKPVDIHEVALRVRNAVQAKHLYDQLRSEREKSDRLLLNIMPEPVALRIKNGETNIADIHDDATVLIANLVGFTSLSAHIEASQIVHLLNEFFSAFDLLAEKQGVEKIKTIGDYYVGACGITVPRPAQTRAVADLALSLRDEVERLNQMYGVSMYLRIGIASGSVIAGVIGRMKLAYDIWGETVNRAWRLESTCQNGKIQIDHASGRTLKDHYRIEEARGFGDTQSDLLTYWLEKAL